MSLEARIIKGHIASISLAHWDMNHHVRSMTTLRLPCWDMIWQHVGEESQPSPTFQPSAPRNQACNRCSHLRRGPPAPRGAVPSIPHMPKLRSQILCSKDNASLLCLTQIPGVQNPWMIKGLWFYTTKFEEMCHTAISNRGDSCLENSCEGSDMWLPLRREPTLNF